MPDRVITIGSLAREAGVNVETIRYYQRRGLLDKPRKPLGGIRHYTEDAIKRVRFIKRAQKLGFTLDEVAILLRLNDGGHCAQTRELAVRKRAVIEAKLTDLEAMRLILGNLIHECDMGSAPGRCPIIASLEEPG